MGVQAVGGPALVVLQDRRRGADHLDGQLLVAARAPHAQAAGWGGFRCERFWFSVPALAASFSPLSALSKTTVSSEQMAVKECLQKFVSFVSHPSSGWGPPQVQWGVFDTYSTQTSIYLTLGWKLAQTVVVDAKGWHKVSRKLSENAGGPCAISAFSSRPHCTGDWEKGFRKLRP